MNASGTQILQNHDLPKPILQQIIEIYPSEFPLLNMDAEKLFLMDHIQELFTDDGSGDGHLIPDQARFYLVPLGYWFPPKGDILGSFDGVTDREHPLDSNINSVIACITHPSRRQTVSAFRQAYKTLAHSITETSYQLHLQGYSHKSLLREVLSANTLTTFS